MILSNSAIFAALDDRRLIIEPEPAPRNPADNPDVDWPYGTSAIDLRLGDEVSWFNDRLAINIDLRRGKFANLFGPNSSSRKITDDQPYSLMPGKLVLANTLERVELPIVPGKTSLAARESRAEAHSRVVVSSSISLPRRFTRGSRVVSHLN